MKCPKCGYTRKFGETAPEWQCPSCGVAYAKAGTAAGGSSRVRAESGGGNKFLMLLVVLALAGGGWAIWKGGRQDSKPAEQAGLVKTGVIMYSLTTCGFCNQKREQLRAEGIPFTEYFVDTDKNAFDEMVQKLQATGMRGGGIGTPTFDVNGKMLMNNPSLDTIKKHL